MANTYTTTIKSLYTIPNPAGYVVNVLFTVSGTDGTHTASIDGNVTFTPQAGETPTPFAQPFGGLPQWVNPALDETWTPGPPPTTPPDYLDPSREEIAHERAQARSET